MYFSKHASYASLASSVDVGTPYRYTHTASKSFMSICRDHSGFECTFDYEEALNYCYTIGYKDGSSSKVHSNPEWSRQIDIKDFEKSLHNLK